MITIQTEHHENQKSLFMRVDEILMQNGLYRVKHENEGMTLDYWFSDDVYTVQKSIDNRKFQLRIGSHHYGYEAFLNKGDILILKATSIHKAWFYCPKLLIGKKTKFITEGSGYTRYGNLETILRLGLIRPKR